MNMNDLTQVKHIGAARMKLLNDAGITTIKQLHETPIEELSQIENIRPHYARLIKEAVKELYGQTTPKPALKAGTGKDKKNALIHQDLQKEIKILKKRLKQTNENLKPLGKKKYLASYIELKKRSKSLRARLKSLGLHQSNLSRKEQKKIIKKAGSLISSLKIAGKKPKKKNYKRIVREIQSFSNSLK